ncbi:MAG: hypothetical protein IKK43_03125 [Clostridia bacterium]|nr:hypothetical protein [Clostridia bacterium]
MNESPREIIIRGLNSQPIDFDAITDMLETFVDAKCEKSKRYAGLKNVIDELREPENIQDEPFECARKLALLIDGFSVLAHIHADIGSQKQLFLRTSKDQIMTRLTKFCMKEQIYVGVCRGEGSLEIDLPYVGHLGWHFGRDENMYGLIRDTGVTEYKRDVENKMSKNGYTYSNSDLLAGVVPVQYLNRTDKNLITTGNIHGRTYER